MGGGVYQIRGCIMSVLIKLSRIGLRWRQYLLFDQTKVLKTTDKCLYKVSWAMLGSRGEGGGGGERGCDKQGYHS